MGDSLFGSDDDSDDERTNPSAHSVNESDRDLPSSQDVIADETRSCFIDGLYVFRSLLPLEMQQSLTSTLQAEQAVTTSHPQAMLFPRNSQAGTDLVNCPPYLKGLVSNLPALLRPCLPFEDYAIVFDETRPLQTILNLYAPGQGITPHVDLPHRYAHPIIGISLGSPTVMDFVSIDGTKDAFAMRVCPGDVYVLLREARYAYKHGIAYRKTDTWRDAEGKLQNTARGTRVSITFRRMLEDVCRLEESADRAM